MTLHLPLSFINIIPALCCSGGSRRGELFEMQREKIKALDLSSRLFTVASQTEGQDRILHNMEGCLSCPRAFKFRFRSHAIPHGGTAFPEVRSYPYTYIYINIWRCQKNLWPRSSSTPFCRPKRSSHPSAWAMALSNTCSPM